MYGVFGINDQARTFTQFLLDLSSFFFITVWFLIWLYGSSLRSDIFPDLSSFFWLLGFCLISNLVCGRGLWSDIRRATMRLQCTPDGSTMLSQAGTTFQSQLLPQLGRGSVGVGVDVGVYIEGFVTSFRQNLNQLITTFWILCINLRRNLTNH